MRLIYTDEAGTSALEPVRVVASVIVNGDLQHRELTREIARVVDKHVPLGIRKDFHAHATEIFSGGKSIDRSTWPFPKRMAFLEEFISIPLRYDVPIAVGVVWANNLPPDLNLSGMNISASTFEHAIAFAFCLERADFFLRKYLHGDEVGTVVAEDVPEKRRFLATAAMMFRKESVTLTPDQLRATPAQISDITPMAPVTYTIENIIDVPNFVAKHDAPLLQLADACAFAFRRCLAKLQGGDELISAMLGKEGAVAFRSNAAWYSVASSGLFSSRVPVGEDDRDGSPEATAPRSVP